jgi:hypothetical protein
MTVLPKRKASSFKAESIGGRSARKRSLARALRMETLEKRELFAVDARPFFNGYYPKDVNADMRIDALDVLNLVNAINSGKGGKNLANVQRGPADGYYDVNGDNVLSALDVLSVVNEVNRRTPEGLNEVASVRYQVYAALPDGTADTTRLLGQTTDGGGITNVDVGVGQNIVLRTQMNDLRSLTTPGIQTFGVFSGHHDIRIENVDGSTGERLQLQWGEFNQLLIPKGANAGSFVLRFAATANHPQTDVTITATSNRAAIQTALEGGFGAGNVRVLTGEATDTANVFDISFRRGRARTNIGDATVINNTVTVSGVAAQPIYFGDPNPSPTSIDTASPARNHNVPTSFQFIDENNNPQTATYVYSQNRSGFYVAPTAVRLATERNYIIVGNDFEDITTIDGVAVALGDRILVRNQTNAAENGIYIVADVPRNSVVRRNLVRAQDADTGAELADALFTVAAGTAAGQTFQQKTQNINLGVSSILFGANSVTTMRETGGFIDPNTGLVDNAWASSYFNVVDVLFKAGSPGEVRLDARLTPTTIEGVLGGIALFDTDKFITDSSAVLLASNLRIRILDELTAFNDEFTMNEDTAATLLDVLQNDRDRSNRTFSIVSVQNNTTNKGDVQIRNNGSRVEFTPVRDANGVASFTYTIRNTAGNESTGTVTVNITPQNDPPIALTPSPVLSVAEDTVAPGLVITPSQLFSPGPADEASQTVSFTGTPTSPNGTVTISGGNLNFVPATNFFGDTTIVVTGQDSGNTSTIGTFTVRVTPVNDPPVAVATTPFQVTEDPATPLSIPVASLFTAGPTNEQSSQTVTLSIVSPPSPEGSAQIQNGSLVFTPTANFSGTVNITVRGTDNGVTGTASDPKSADSIITITVTPVNDDPDAVNDTLAVIGLNTPQPLDVLANDTPGPREQGVDTIRVTAVTQPSVGTVAIGTNGSNVIFTPPGGVFDQRVTFTYTITDGGNRTDTASVEVYIAPPARPFALDDTFRVAEDSSITDLTVLLNDFVRAQQNAVLESIDSLPSGQTPVIPAAQGALQIVGNVIGFTPAANFFGDVARFTYRMNDDSGQAPENGSRQVATVTVIVTEVNDAPVATNLDRSTNEDTPLSMTGTSITTGLSRGPNEDAQTLTITAARLLNAAAGTVALTNGNLAFTPAADFSGNANIEYTVTDNGTTNGVAAALSSTATITVRVDAVNDDPVTTNKSVTGVEDTSRTIAISDVILNDQPGPANESSQTVSFDALPSGTTAQGGTVSVVGTNVVYTPAANFNGQDTFVYRVIDNGTPAATALGTVTINVSEVNDDPVAVNVTRGNVFASVRTEFNLTEDLRQMSRGAANESGQTLRIVSVGRSTLGVQPTISADGQTIIYTAPLGASGQDSFSYTVEDNGTTSGVADVKRSTANLNLNISPFIPSSFTGFVFVDDDGNRQKDVGDLALGGVDVYLYEGTPANKPERSTWKHEVTDAAGRYDFGFLPPGTFTVEYVVPSFIQDAADANFLTQTIVAPGNVNVRKDFAVLGLQPGYGSILENLASSYYLTDAGLRSAGLVAVMGADGKSEWTSIKGGGFETDTFHEVVLSEDRRNAYVTAVRGADVYTATLPRNKFVVVQDSEGRMLIRVVARVSDLTWNRVNTAAPPVLPAKKYFAAVDEFFSTMADD